MSSRLPAPPVGAAPPTRGPLRVGSALLLTLLVTLGGCASSRLDEPGKVRHDKVPLSPWLSPIFDYSASDDGTSWQWSALLWMIAAERENETRHSRVFPFWWRNSDPPYSDSTLLFPLYYSRNSPAERRRFYSFLYGYVDGDEARTDWVLPPFFHYDRSKTEDVSSSGFLFLYDYRNEGSRQAFTLLPILGLAHAAKFEWGLPPQGVNVPALGRSGSRRFELLNLLGFITLFGYDDVGDRREIRFLTLLSSEMLSPIRSWRGRGDDPFVREWVFPLYMNVQDPADGWFYVGPLWGRISDRVEQTETDWWLLGLLSRKAAPEGVSWSLFGLTVWGP